MKTDRIFPYPIFIFCRLKVQYVYMQEIQFKTKKKSTTIMNRNNGFDTTSPAGQKFLY